MEHDIVWFCARDQSWGEFEINHLGKVTLPVTKFCWWGWLRIIDAVVCKEYQSHFFLRIYWILMNIDIKQDTCAHTFAKFLFLVYYTSMEVSWNGGTPKSSPLVGCSIINHAFLGTHGRKPASPAGASRSKWILQLGAKRIARDCQNDGDSAKSASVC